MFEIVTLRSAHETDCTMYPCVGGTPGRVRPEPGDGQAVRQVNITALAVARHGSDQYLVVTDVEAVLSITDCRVVVVCADPWAGEIRGDPAWAATRSADGSAVLAGHVRYPWLSDAGYQLAGGEESQALIRLVLHDGTEPGAPAVRFDALLAPGYDGARVANFIARRAALYRLDTDPTMLGDLRAETLAVAKAAPLAPVRDSFAVHHLPIYRNALPATAFPLTAS